MVHCPHCGVVPVKESDLPVELPDESPSTSKAIRSPRHPTWKHVACPELRRGGGARDRHARHLRRFSWYFARFCDTHADPVGREAVDYWLPVDQYIGGIEHAILHLLYARFFVRAMKQAAG